MKHPSTLRFHSGQAALRAGPSWKSLFLTLMLLFPVLASAQTEGWLPPPPPADVCEQVTKNVRAAYVSWVSGATQSFTDLKRDMSAALAGKGKKEEKLKAIYEKTFERIEANEFSPPKFPTRVEGHIAAKKFAEDLCHEEVKEERR
ncbi:MAG: hypothetical protein ACREV9_00600 [Burkholderiales bacterium]